jgi:hypothetical protein
MGMWGMFHMADSVKFFDGKKYMWDYEDYPDKSAAQMKAQQYTQNKFEVKIVEQSGKHYVYTRRVVTSMPQG